MYKRTTKASAIYHVRDSIDNFHFSISFRQINSLLNLPKFDVKTGSTNVDKDSSGGGDIKVINIKWQEKLLSVQETEYFRDISNCITDVQKVYHQLILRNEEDSIRHMTEPIFTYINDDNFVPEDEKLTPANPLKPDDSTEMVMYVYAALNPNTMLLSLRWQPFEKILHIYPDFNSFRENPYFIEIDMDYRHLYAYGIENISKQSQKKRDEAFELHIPDIPHWENSAELSKMFMMPPKRSRRVVLFFEIQCAEGFEYDNIHVRYHVSLPKGSIQESGLLSASTHSSKVNRHGVWSLGHCWEIVLLCEEDLEMQSSCHVYFEVISVDSWERERVEGYTHMSCFLEPGLDVSMLQCHRPLEGGILEKLSRYFIGGRRKFDFESFYACDEGFNNRYGTKMMTTGTITVRCQRLTQRNPSLLKPAPGKIIGMTLEDIMKAYREARRRLEAAV